jgi:hypothetical protein
MIKSFVPAIVLVSALAAPVVSFAQSNAPVTRAQVRAELVQLQNAGYRGDDQVHYPERIQAAEARVAAQNGASSSVGGVVSGSLASGAPATVVGLPPIYSGS